MSTQHPEMGFYRQILSHILSKHPVKPSVHNSTIMVFKSSLLTIGFAVASRAATDPTTVSHVATVPSLNNSSSTLDNTL